MIKANDPTFIPFQKIPNLNNIIMFEESKKIYNIEKYDKVLKYLYKKLPFELVYKIYEHLDPTIEYNLFEKTCSLMLNIKNTTYNIDVPILTQHILPKTIIIKKDCQEEILDKFKNMLKNREININPV